MIIGNNNIRDVQEYAASVAGGVKTELQSKVEHLDMSHLTRDRALDTFEKSVDVTDILCENYPNYQIRTCMPISVFGDKFGYDMQKDIANCMTGLYSGKINQDDVDKFFKECCDEMRLYRTQQRQTTGSDTKDNNQIVSQIYEIFAKENQRAARNANYNEGLAYNEKYGERNDDWVYYNSDFHYMCEDRKSAIQMAAKSVTEEWGLPEINTQEIEANSKHTLDGGFDFNSGWNFSYRNQVGRGSMEDETVIPPRDFRFFYKEHLASGYEGLLDININGKQHSVRVPFAISDNGGLKGQIFDLSELSDGLFADKNEYREYQSLLKNFTIFTRWYSFKTKINDTFGNFIAERS